MSRLGSALALDNQTRRLPGLMSNPGADRITSGVGPPNHEACGFSLQVRRSASISVTFRPTVDLAVGGRRDSELHAQGWAIDRALCPGMLIVSEDDALQFKQIGPPMTSGVRQRMLEGTSRGGDDQRPIARDQRVSGKAARCSPVTSPAQGSAPASA